MLPPDQLLQEAYRTSQDDSMEMFYPTMLVLHSFLTETTDYQERIRLLQDICKNHVAYLKEFNLPVATVASIYLECESLIRYNEILSKLMTSTQNQSIVKDNIANMPLLQIEQYIYLSALRELGVPYFIAFTEGYSYYVRHPKEKKQYDLSMAILQVKNFLGKLYSEDIMDFCRHLFCGEATRLYKIGALKKDECFGIHNFDVTFRNHCFDVYIDIKKQEIAEEMNADNDRLYPPTIIDYLNQLLEESECVVNREMQFEQFQGSYAYDQQYYVGRPDVLKMAGYFVVYLQDKINQFKTSQSAQPITFNGPTTYTEIHDNNNITILCDVGKIEMSANNVVIPQPGSTTNVGCDQRESKFTNNLSQEAVKQLQADNENKQLK